MFNNAAKRSETLHWDEVSMQYSIMARNSFYQPFPTPTIWRLMGSGLKVMFTSTCSETNYLTCCKTKLLTSARWLLRNVQCATSPTSGHWYVRYVCKLKNKATKLNAKHIFIHSEKYRDATWEASWFLVWVSSSLWATGKKAPKYANNKLSNQIISPSILHITLKWFTRACLILWRGAELNFGHIWGMTISTCHLLWGSEEDRHVSINLAHREEATTSADKPTSPCCLWSRYSMYSSPAH